MARLALLTQLVMLSLPAAGCGVDPEPHHPADLATLQSRSDLPELAEACRGLIGRGVRTEVSSTRPGCTLFADLPPILRALEDGSTCVIADDHWARIGFAHPAGSWAESASLSCFKDGLPAAEATEVATGLWFTPRQVGRQVHESSAVRRTDS